MYCNKCTKVFSKLTEGKERPYRHGKVWFTVYDMEDNPGKCMHKLLKRQTYLLNKNCSPERASNKKVSTPNNANKPPKMKRTRSQVSVESISDSASSADFDEPRRVYLTRSQKFSNIRRTRSGRIVRIPKRYLD